MKPCVPLAPLLILAALARPAAPHGRPQETPPGAQGADPREEMRQLFRDVESALQRIDLQLADAGAGEVPLEQVADSGIEKLLRDTQRESSAAISKMDRILELATQMGQQSSGGSSSNSPSPLDQKRDQGPLDRERTPEGPGKKDAPQESGSKDQQRPGQGKEPKDPGDSKERGESRGEKLPDAGGEAVPRKEDSDPWGFLPPRAQEVFRNQGGSDMPVQYREWIDSYYKRLNATRR